MTDSSGYVNLARYWKIPMGFSLESMGHEWRPHEMLWRVRGKSWGIYGIPGKMCGISMYSHTGHLKSRKFEQA